MKLKTLSALSAIFVCVAGPLPAADRAAEDLLARIEETQRTSGAMIRVKLSVEDTKTAQNTAAQIRIRVRRDATVTRLLYQVLWPTERKGQALYIERSGKGTTSGFVYEPPDKTTPVNASVMTRSYLDSDLTIEDLAEDFWQWPSPRIIGEETIGGEACKIVESRPPPGAKIGYSVIRSWVSPEKLVPLRIEKFGRDKRLAKRFTVQKTTRHDNIWVPITTIVQSPGSSRLTTLELSRGDREIEIPVEEFSPERIKSPPP